MQKLSVALATFNEEENIRMCLNAVHGWADEIVIVDGTSTDKTAEIAKSLGARVIEKPNQKNFHINKQIAIDACKHPWILQLDADEVVSESQKKEIDRIRKGEAEEVFDGYWMPRKNWFLGRFLMKGGQYPDYTLRFYKNGKGRLPQKDVHEQAVVDGKVGYLKEALLHYPYKDFTFYIKKWNRYNIFAADLLKQELKHTPFGTKIQRFFLDLFIRPVWWFLWVYGRHKGFMDSWQGFVFCFFSAIRFPVSYLIYLRNTLMFRE
ncbi:MAG: glycosyltransferase family 2 protein [Candidatus Levyibacteriota bacterium]